MELCVEKGLNSDTAIEFSTMTILQLTRRFLSSSFWPKKSITEIDHPLSPFTWLHMTFGYLQE
jgi:hypothetical protein